MSKNEKEKDVREMSEEESYDGYENEGMENEGESSDLEDVVLTKSYSSESCRIPGNVSPPESQEEVERNANEEEEEEEEEKERILREKWFNVTGKKPRNIPTVKRYIDESLENTVFFGDRRPVDIERNRRKKMQQAAERIHRMGLKYGKLRSEIAIPSSSQGLICFKFAPDATSMAASDRSGGVQVRKYLTGELMNSLQTKESIDKLPVRSVVYHPSNCEHLFAGGETGIVQVFHAHTGQTLGSSDSYGTIYAMDISPTGKVIAIGGRNGKLCLADAQTLQLIWVKMWPDVSDMTEPLVEDRYHKQRIYGIKFHHSEVNVFATGGWDRTVKLWDIRAPEVITSITGPQIYGCGLDLRNNLILTASWRAENSLSLWNFPTGKLIKNIPINNKSTKYEGEFLYAAEFFKDNSASDAVSGDLIAVGGSGFPEMLVINLHTEKVLSYFPSFKAVLTLDIHDNFVGYGGKESTFRIAEVENKLKKQTPKQ